MSTRKKKIFSLLIFTQHSRVRDVESIWGGSLHGARTTVAKLFIIKFDLENIIDKNRRTKMKTKTPKKNNEIFWMPQAHAISEWVISYFISWSVGRSFVAEMQRDNSIFNISSVIGCRIHWKMIAIKCVMCSIAYNFASNCCYLLIYCQK